jgi:hypothetical protein
LTRLHPAFSPFQAARHLIASKHFDSFAQLNQAFDLPMALA